MIQNGEPVASSRVALLAEGVDRTYLFQRIGGEIGQVALLAEGVDRNILS